MCPTGELLKDIPLFQLLDDSEREVLASKLELVRFAAAKPVFQIGDPGDAIYIIASGEAEVFFKNDTGERMVLERPGKGDFFGELSFLDGEPRSAKVWAVADSELYRLDFHEYESFADAHPREACNLLFAIGRVRNGWHAKRPVFVFWFLYPVLF